MAAGRGQFFLSLMQGLQQARPGGLRDRKKKHAGSARAGRQRSENTRPAELPVPHPPPATSSSTSRPSSLPTFHRLHATCLLQLRKLPPEIILKIFSYLDADSLLCVTFVNRQFHKLANDNAIWYELYAHEIERKRWRPRLAVQPESPAGVQDMPPGFWKRLIFREMGCPKDTSWKKELRHINPYTGMPAQTQQLLGSLRVSWEITLTQKGGQESVYKQNHNFFSDSSVTVCWSNGVWPRIRQVSTLQLHGVIRPFTSTTTDKPQWRSLISKTDVCRMERWKFIGTDKLVKLLQFDEGITVGIWRGTWTIAFIMANLHFHKLVERSLLGSLSCPYRPPEVTLYDDVDPDYDPQGYTVLIVLHNSVRRIMHRRYSPLLCSRDSVHDGFAQFRLTSEHTPVLGRISFPWMAERGLQGDIKNCCMMTVTVLDESQRPLWCLSSAGSLLLSTYNNEEFVLLLHDDAKGRVRMSFAWMQDMQQYFLIGLHVRISITKLNKRFK
ncbi:LOW QUALITY PROTEIN: F-box only protein 15 [Colossoma macropomum]|uniref:LOW QUALITY PROTEIN: F-box only protein 15 n=1 Tax=Colossoma macropomum TaxID=42526 RepID=UPI0018653B3B|nr:LOW QUALITY PROTEIN: F-box only protein 15 [Colossoma macropomum]